MPIHGMPVTWDFPNLSSPTIQTGNTNDLTAATNSEVLPVTVIVITIVIQLTELTASSGP